MLLRQNPDMILMGLLQKREEMSSKMIRWRFYREHKFVLSMTTSLEQLIAKSDFTNDAQVAEVSKNLEDLIALMQGHAQYEDSAIHALLRAKDSEIHKKTEEEHGLQDQIFAKLREKLVQISASADQEERLILGYDFYLSYREFEVANLQHINQEERLIMPELQRLYSDDELSAVERQGAYAEMTAEEMVEMTQVLFPHMSPDDHAQFLEDIKVSRPEHFDLVWKNVGPLVGQGS